MNGYIESETLELKEKYTDTIVKEIVAFLNAKGGRIIVGVKDDGTVVGVQKSDEVLRKISDIITSQIEPNPQEDINTVIEDKNNKILVVIKIEKGRKHLYCQKKYGFSSVGCSIRIGTTCKTMTEDQIEGRYKNKFVDTEYILKTQSSMLDLTFRDFKIFYSEKGNHVVDSNFEKNFKLKIDNKEYNLLAELLADKNNIPLMFVKFKGKDKSAISERSDYGHGCILTTYEKIKTRLEGENVCKTDTTVRPRKDTYLFDFDCVNEAIINALVHNDWTITEPEIAMYDNRLEILSHGGLPYGMSKKNFFEGISKPRNKTLMRIFLAVGLTEHTGHGIPTIVNKYGEDAFEIDDNYIRCTIPFNIDDSIENKSWFADLNKTEKRVIQLLGTNPYYTSEQLSDKLGLVKRTIERTFKSLQEKEIIARIGTRKSGYWIIIDRKHLRR